MAKASGRLERWTDSVLGDFTWNNGVWNGSCEFNGCTVRLQLDSDNTYPTKEEQLAVFEPSRPILVRLREVEPELFVKPRTKDIATGVDSEWAAAKALKIGKETRARGTDQGEVRMGERESFRHLLGTA